MRIKLYHTFLIVINIFAILLVLQIQLKLIPLIDSNFNQSFIEEFNSLILNIAIGLIISSIFYLIVVYYPDFSKRKSTFNIIEPRLKTIINQLEQSIHYLHDKRLPTTSKIHRLKEKDFEELTIIDNRLMNFSYKIIGTHGKWIPFGTGTQSEIEFFEHQRKLVREKIDYILSLPTIIYLDDELIEVLAKLRDSWFYSGIESYYNWRKAPKFINVNNFNKGSFEYYQHYKKIKKFIKPNKFEIK